MRTELTIINRRMAIRFIPLLLVTTLLNRVVLSFKAYPFMRFVFFILLVCSSSSAWSQPWQEALKNARQSYLVKSYDQAVSHYRQAQKLAPTNVDLSLELAQSLYHAGKYPEAEKLYKSQLKKKQTNVSDADIHRQLGNSRMHQEKYSEAIDSYKSSLRANPKDPSARHNLAKALQKQQEKENPKENNPKENQNQQDPPKQEEEDSKSKEENQKNKPQESKEENKPANNPSNNQKEMKEEPSLSDKRTERLLEELTQKEKETKRNMNSKIDDKSKTRNQVKKDW